MTEHIDVELPTWEAERLRESARQHGVPIEVEARRLIERELGPFDFAPGLPDPDQLL